MAISDLHQFLKEYFQAHHCTIVEDRPNLLSVKLTEEMDKALMNRPFYWHYIKKIGQAGEPKQLTFITDPEEKTATGEHIHFGSPRLQQIINHLKTNERFARLYQHLSTSARTPLYPWLVTNVKLSYIGQQNKEQLFSIGLNLINGVMKTEMMEQLQSIDLQMTIPDYCYVISPMIKPGSGFRRIQAVLDQYISDQDHDWANLSMQACARESELLKAFYDGQSDEAAEQMEKELQKFINAMNQRLTSLSLMAACFIWQQTNNKGASALTG
ncbi:YqhG family protein [Tigheibacillus jepli]|uniref:YqhG family protein n=1 Tax=Tigheibacillus jepli TaxID=3035914 RepID=UPI00387E04E4